MRKTYVLLLSLLMIATLTACGEDDEQTSQPPVFQSLMINGDYPVENGEQVAFPFEKNEEFTLELRFSNPDNVEFNTVQINGSTFRAHRFSGESTANTLVLNLNAGRIPDETIFEVEEVEYIDNEGVKSVAITEDNAYTVFVMREDPTANIASLSPLETALEFEVSLSDEDDTLKEAFVEVIREEDDTVVDSMEIPESYLSNTFDDLRSDETYYLRIIADYETDDPDNESGVITDEIIATSNSVTTASKNAPTASIENASVFETSYEFDIVYNDESEVLIGDSLYLEVEQINEDEDNTIVINEDVNLSNLQDIVFDSLFNNNDYTVYIYADYDLDDGEGVRNDVLLATTTFTTPKREIEDISTETVSLTEDSLTLSIDATQLFDSVIVDNMRIKAIDSASGELLKSSDLLTQQLTFKLNQLYANQTIDIEIEVTYDLEDGQDLRTEVLHESSFTTMSNAIPSASVENVDAVQGGLEFSVQLNDADNTVVPDTLRAIIYHDDGTDLSIVDTYTLDTETSDYFYEMTTNYEYAYSIELITDYDLRDNTGAVEDYELSTSYVVGSAHPKIPVAQFEAITVTQSGADIDYRILDDDAAILNGGMELVIDNDVYPLTDLEGTFSIDTLSPGQDYDVLLNITYDIGGGERTLTVSESFTTEAEETTTE